MNSSVKKIRIVMVRVRVTWSLYYFLLLVKTPRNNWTRKQIQQTPKIPCEVSHSQTYCNNWMIRSRKKRWKRPSGTSTIILYIATFSRNDVKEKKKGRNWKTTRTLQRQLVKRRLTSYAPELDANDTIEPIVRWGSRDRYIDKVAVGRVIILLPFVITDSYWYEWSRMLLVDVIISHYCHCQYRSLLLPVLAVADSIE